MQEASSKFRNLGSPRRIWAVAATQGNARLLAAIHDALAERFRAGDRLVYLGTYLGPRTEDNETVMTELLAFRAALLAKPGLETTDIVHLRGPAEEAWQRLLRLQFASVPGRAVETLLAEGAGDFLHLYGQGVREARQIAKADSPTITRWTSHLRLLQRLSPGHEAFACSLARAAFTSGDGGQSLKPLLFVPAGFEACRSLEDQGDSLWYNSLSFGINMDECPYVRVVRGFDARGGGIHLEGPAVTLSDVPHSLTCACFDAAGNVVDVVREGSREEACERKREDSSSPGCLHASAAA